MTSRGTDARDEATFPKIAGRRVSGAAHAGQDVVDQEQFVPLTPYRDVVDALTQANDTTFGFTHQQIAYGGGTQQ